jgi:hypothetical protein
MLVMLLGFLDVTSTAYQDYNNLYRITNVPVGSATSFTAVSATPVSSPTVGWKYIHF